jgi:hypothetical protein
MPEPLFTAGLILAGYSTAVALARPRSAVSSEAESVRVNASTLVERAYRSVALYGSKALLISNLTALGEECREPNWDGYGAEPVNPSVLNSAMDLIESLPDDLPLPECSIEPDGCVSLDWMPAPYRTLSLSVSVTGRLPYAWVDGTDRGHAVARLVDGLLPPRIITEIRRLVSYEPSVRAA